MASNLVRGMEWQTAELGRVSFHMLEDQEAAARRFSHELHDELGQSLTAVKANLAAIEGNSARVADCIHLVDEAIGNVREMSQLLRPTILDDFGLAAGLRWLCEGSTSPARFLLLAGCPMGPKRTSSASPRKPSPTWHATLPPSTYECSWNRRTIT
jgi:signal transduction histidine kinase